MSAALKTDGALALALPHNTKYTYKDYSGWGPEVDRCELIDGEIYYMAAPSRQHQRVLVMLCTAFEQHFKDKTCDVFIAPFDVRLNFDTHDNIVVQPDLMVICEPKKLEDDKACKGAPDLVAEILSPSTARMDLHVKFKRYADFGVREYWLINPLEKTVHIYALSGGKFESMSFADESDESVKSVIFEDFVVAVRDIFRGV